MDPDGESSLYYPSPSNAPSNAETTLSQRIIKTSMPKPAKKRVDKVTPKRCLITYGSKYLDNAHCLPRSTKEPLLDRLEFAWNMERFTLNVDTRYKHHPSESPHCIGHSMRMIGYFSPETRIIDAYYNARNTRGLPDIDAKVYKYTLVSTRGDAGDTDTNRQKPPPPDSPMRPPPRGFVLTITLYPYMTSPLSNRMSIPVQLYATAAPKLVAATGLYETTNLKDDLVKVQVIWNSWMKAVLTKEFLEKTSDGADPTSRTIAARRLILVARSCDAHFVNGKAAGGQDSTRAQEF
ncbi:hypothetical protein EDB84DRAFT_1680484 [Lactarius hengduanensis]|nr:hypothetical protein EDB84DRAFT_1680484 [Lactarius hengduanensis]